MTYAEKIQKETSDINALILYQRKTKLNAQPMTPRVGDYLKHLGSYDRFTYHWGDSIQTGGFEHGSYYLGCYGHLSYSGGLDTGIDPTLLEETDEEKKGDVWFFSKDHHVAHNGITYSISFKVYKFKPLNFMADFVKMPTYSSVWECTEDLYDYALSTVPPISRNGSFFAMGEPYSHRNDGVPIYYCFVERNGVFYITLASVNRALEDFKKHLPI